MLVLLSGFLGAGKTTTMLAAARRLEADGQRVAVITNDQAADLVDTALARSALDQVAEIAGGCFCCRFEDLEAALAPLVGTRDVVIAEAVGSCTDLQATVVRPLRRRYGLRVAPVTAIVDPARYRELADDDSDLGYLYAKQIEEADIVAVNKADIDPGVDLPGALHYSARTGAGLPELIAAWSAEPAEETDLELDYDRYAAAEAALAWLNHTVELTAGVPFSPARWAERTLAELTGTGHLLGHAKVAVDSPAGLVKMSLTGTEPQRDLAGPGTVLLATATLNVRMACPPAELDALVRRAAAVAAEAVGAKVGNTRGEAFRPAYPKPTYRLSARGV